MHTKRAAIMIIGTKMIAALANVYFLAGKECVGASIDKVDSRLDTAQLLLIRPAFLALQRVGQSTRTE
jgi:hypothetical protein